MPLKRPFPPLDVHDFPDGFLKLSILPKNPSNFVNGILGISESCFVEGKMNKDFHRTKVVYYKENNIHGFLSLNGQLDTESRLPNPIILFSSRDVLWAAPNKDGTFLTFNPYTWDFKLNLPSQIPHPAFKDTYSDADPGRVLLPLPSSECHSRRVHCQLRAIVDPSLSHVRAWQCKKPLHVINFTSLRRLFRSVSSESGLYCGISTDSGDSESTESAKKNLLEKVITDIKKKTKTPPQGLLECDICFLSSTFGLGDEVQAVINWSLPPGFTMQCIKVGLAQKVTTAEQKMVRRKSTGKKKKNEVMFQRRLTLPARAVRFAEVEANLTPSNTVPTVKTGSAKANATVKPILNYSSDPETIEDDTNATISTAASTFHDGEFVISTNVDIPEPAKSLTKIQKSSQALSFTIPSTRNLPLSTTTSSMLNNQTVYAPKRFIFTSCKCQTHHIHVFHALMTIINIEAPSSSAAHEIANLLEVAAELQNHDRKHIDISCVKELITIQITMTVKILPCDSIMFEFVREMYKTRKRSPSRHQPESSLKTQIGTHFSISGNLSEPNLGRKFEPELDGPPAEVHLLERKSTKKANSLLDLAASIAEGLDKKLQI
ncbi:hypothetical protein HK098_004832 [Nowakowskiella sp. JEL0407]|nr:hypothetical protein HK098_004832 [Nowakowskiella sp. JEL0407]